MSMAFIKSESLTSMRAGLIGLLMIVIFSLDLVTPLGYAAWILYSIPLFLALHAPSQRLVLIVAGSCSLLVILGFFLSTSTVPEADAITNRLLGLCSLWLVTLGIVARQRMQVAWQDQEERFRLLLDGAKGYGFFALDPEGHVVSWSHSAERVTGYRSEEIIGQHISVVHPVEQGEQDHASVMLRQAMTSGPVEIAGWRIRKDGSRFWASGTLTALWDHSGQIRGFTTVLRDMANERRAAEAHTELSQRNESLVQALGELVYDHDVSQDHIAWAGDSEKLLGCRTEELGTTTKAWLDRVHPDDRQRVLGELKKPPTNGSVFAAEYRFLGQNGHYIWIHDRGIMHVGHEGELTRVTGVMLDITHRRHSEEALRVSEMRFQSFMDNSQLVAFIKHADGRYLYANKRWEQCFKKSVSDIMGQTDHDVWPGAVALKLRANDEAVLRSGEVIETEEELPDSDGHLRTWLVRNFPLTDRAADRLVGGVAIDITDRKRAEEQAADRLVGGVAIDITDRKRAEEQAKQAADQLRALSGHLQTVREEERKRIARELHDEMSQLLTGLKMDISWLQRQLSESAPSKQGQVSPLVDKTQDMTVLIDQSITAVRRIISELRPAVLDHLGLVAALEWQAGEFERRTGIQCRFSTAVSQVDLDEIGTTTLFRVLQEALTNIMKHAGATAAAVRLEQDSGQVRLMVEDNGTGIRTDQPPNRESFGIVGIRERVALSKGTVSLVSRGTSGTTLTAVIPVRGAQ